MGNLENLQMSSVRLVRHKCLLQLVCFVSQVAEQRVVLIARLYLGSSCSSGGMLCSLELGMPLALKS